MTLRLFVPCTGSVLVIMKQRGKSFAVAAWLGSVRVAFFVGGVVAQVVGLL